MRYPALGAVIALVLAGCATPSSPARQASFLLPDSSERLYWSYPRDDEGSLAVLEDHGAKRGLPDNAVLTLRCDADGTLQVEARHLMLSSDVPLPFDPADYTRLVLESGGVRLEAPLHRQGNGFGSWAHGGFEHGSAAASALISGSPLVVRAVRRTPVAERTARDEDLSVSYPAPDRGQAALFLAHCAKTAGGTRPQ